MSDSQSSSQPPSTKANRPFPSVTGGCFCTKTRYRLDRPPLFCHACHCSDCQKSSGSVFACFATIESTAIAYGSNPPKITRTISAQPSKKVRSVASCGFCGTELWVVGDHSAYTAIIKVGTLDHPELMEPDLYAFVENKVPWVILPEGAKTCKGQYDFRKAWPASSLSRFEAIKRADEEQRMAEGAQAVGSGEAEENTEEEEMIETPTAQSPDEGEIEDEAEFEKRTMEAERALLERLEKLALKLDGKKKEESVKEM